MTLDPNRPYFSAPAGPAVVQLPTHTMGKVEALHAHETSYISHRCAHGRPWVGIGLALAYTGDEKFGLYVSLTPDEARDHAANLLRIANELDAGKGTQ